MLADRSTAALYVRVGEQLHLVLNLTSAWLIVGRPVCLTTVKVPSWTARKPDQSRVRRSGMVREHHRRELDGVTAQRTARGRCGWRV